MKFPYRLLLAFLLIAASTAAHAAPYFSAGSISPKLIDPPLSTNSSAWQDEVKQIVAMQKNPATDEVAQALSERSLRPEMVAMADPTLTRESHPALYKLLDRVADTSHGVTDSAKNYWNTRRPYLMSKDIKVLIEPHDNPSYPSGHTTGSYVWAHVLSMVIPDERERFMAKAESIAQHRVLVGMHYPHDLRGGKQLALLIVGGLTQQAEFKDDLEKAQKEYKEKHN